MRVDIDMWGVELATLTRTELSLIDRARIAAKPLAITSNVQYKGLAKREHCVLIAHIAPNPLRIDFALHGTDTLWNDRRVAGVLYTGPQLPLTEALFSGEGFNNTLIQQLRERVAAVESV